MEGWWARGVGIRDFSYLIHSSITIIILYLILFFLIKVGKLFLTFLKLLYNWYSDISVRIEWYTLGKDIQICKGTRQGGLTSPFLFNIFYKDLVDILASHEGGNTIDGVRFNVFVYANDILLTSTTASGLQNLIDSAVGYVLQHGLHFNPNKNTLYNYW